MNSRMIVFQLNESAKIERGCEPRARWVTRIACWTRIVTETCARCGI